jgi:hypothetical protein
MQTLRRVALTFVLAVIGVVIAAVMEPLAMAQAAEPPLPTADSLPEAPAKPPVPPDDPAVQAHLPGCAVWTDRCVTCRHEAGRTLCSNTGIACEPQAVECVRSEAEEGGKPESKKPEN